MVRVEASDNSTVLNLAQKTQLYVSRPQGDVMSLRNCVVLPVIFFTLAMLVACGSTNNAVPPPSGAFSNTDFSGTYTFSTVGTDVGAGGNLSGLIMAGSLNACGCTSGQISGGSVDLADNTGGIGVAAIGSTSVYSISKDGRGFAKLLITPTGGTQFEADVDFVLTSSSHGLITRFDQGGSGSGTLDLQSTVAQTTLANTGFAFSLTGTDMAGNPLAQVGAFTLDSSGNIITTGANAGVADTTLYNFGTFSATPFANSPLSGTVLVGSGTTPGTASLLTSLSGQALVFDVYTVDATHLKLIESDGLALLVGDVFTQPSASIAQGNYVFTMAGFDPGGNPFAAGGLMQSDGTSTISNGAEDLNDNGTVDFGTTTPQAFSGSFTNVPSVGAGRFQVTLSTFAGGTTFAAYPSSGGLLMLEIDNFGAGSGITGGVALAQTSGAALAASQGYGMNLTGTDLTIGAELDEIAQFNTTSTGMTGLLDENDAAFTGVGSLGTGNLNGTYTAGSNGTGSASFNTGVESVFYYMVDNSTALFISTDTNPVDQVSLGSFEAQSTPTQSALEQPHARALPMLRAMARSRKASARGTARFVRK